VTCTHRARKRSRCAASAARAKNSAAGQGRLRFDLDEVKRRLSCCASRGSDPLETKLKRQVCRRQMTLARARAAIPLFKFKFG
jgi:hypothetical protein